MAEQSTCARVEPAETERTHSPCAETKKKSIKKPTGWNSFMQSVAPDVKEQLGKGAGIGQVSKVVGNMWKKLPTDRRKDWKDKAQSLREDLDMGIAEIKNVQPAAPSSQGRRTSNTTRKVVMSAFARNAMNRLTMSKS
ncbi:unnamed protein product [Pocillopora meandrina]|uniref:HMG box domain-containing protein n=1 Tax=Pocillopora meandrina TaxID=46732 RepID=A0AAU9XZR1_9CNID|nr:unnamed protein product [Pocillopora meandrina]